MCDFEKSFQNAVNIVFGQNVQVTGCLFHLSQCAWRKIQLLNLTQAYQEDEQSRTFCKMLIALAFVPAEDSAAAFESLIEDIPENLKHWLIILKTPGLEDHSDVDAGTRFFCQSCGLCTFACREICPDQIIRLKDGTMQCRVHSVIIIQQSTN